MKILFLTMTRFGDGSEAGIYTDLMRKFRDEGHDVYVVENNSRVPAGKVEICPNPFEVQSDGFGVWAQNNSVEAFTVAVDKMLQSDIKAMGEKGYEFFLKNYTVQHSYNAIIKHCK